ncbi:MAG: FmdB family zinc ribbon protein [Gemmataceae bacterium]
MPTYDYVCDACTHEFEEFQSMSEEPLKKCPKCNKKKLRRKIGTGAALIFRGSGFYITDYRSESYKAAAQADQSNGSTASNGTNGTNGTNGAANGHSSANGAKSASEKAKSTT